MDVLMRCPCPDKDGETRHPDGDSVTLRDKLDFHTATTIRKALGLVENDDPRTRTAEVLATLSEFYVLMGIRAWTLVDEKGVPIEVSQSAIRATVLESPDVDLVIEAADELYNQAILLPLLARASISSPPTPTPSPDEAASTSPMLTLPTPLKPSKQSLTTTSPTVVTETITSSSDGDSNSSQNSASAA